MNHHHPQARPVAVKRYRYIGVMREHRARATAALGKPLPPGSEVHHADLSLDMAAPLVICQDHAYHRLLHARTRIVRAGGNPNTQRICGQCKTLKLIAEMAKSGRGDGIHNVCSACCAKRTNERYHRLKPHLVLA